MIRGQARNSSDSTGQATDPRLVEVSKYLKSEVAAEESEQCGYLPPSIKASRSALILKPPNLLNCERSGVGGMELYFPGGNAQVHHC
jgi:hypothetical protein